MKKIIPILIILFWGGGITRAGIPFVDLLAKAQRIDHYIKQLNKIKEQISTMKELTEMFKQRRLAFRLANGGFEKEELAAIMPDAATTEQILASSFFDSLSESSLLRNLFNTLEASLAVDWLGSALDLYGEFFQQEDIKDLIQSKASMDEKYRKHLQAFLEKLRLIREKEKAELLRLSKHIDQRMFDYAQKACVFMNTSEAPDPVAKTSKLIATNAFLKYAQYRTLLNTMILLRSQKEHLLIEKIMSVLADRKYLKLNHDRQQKSMDKE
jgi:hypothetical protein